jgi:Probable transposase.
VLELDDADLPEKPDLNASNSVGSDLGIHTSDWTTVDWTELARSWRRLQVITSRTSKLSRKEKAKRSNNSKNQRREVTNVKRHVRRQVLDSQHKSTTWLVGKCGTAFVEELK